MGWSCAKKANDTLDQLVRYFLEKGEKSQNTFGEGRYFFEVNTQREHRDGAITGKVFEFVGPVHNTANQTGLHAFQRGSFRINPDGKIARFTALPAEVKKYLNALTTEAFVVIPQ